MVRLLAEMRDTLFICAKAYIHFILFYLFVAMVRQAIKDSANNPNHWA